MSPIPRPQKILFPILREALPHITFYSWVNAIEDRTYPFVSVRTLGGIRHRTHPFELSNPILEVASYSDVDLIEAENNYNDVLDALFEAQLTQKQTDHGYIHSVFETMGMTQFSSEYQASWRSQGLVKVGIRPPRT